MDRRDVQSGIHRAWALVGSLELGETISSSTPLGVNEEFRDLILTEETDYVTIYTTGLHLSHYNFLLTDYSFFQFSWTASDHVRYGFFPNPFAARANTDLFAQITEWREHVTAELINHEEYLDLLRDLKPEIRIPLVRYENAPDQYRGLHHPCSHLHIGHHADNRWPLNRVLTPLAFTQLILKYYYGPTWREFGIDDSDEAGNTLESQLIGEKMNCRIIGDTLFSSMEARSFYFS